jgi:hypothetical protein
VTTEYVHDEDALPRTLTTLRDAPLPWGIDDLPAMVARLGWRAHAVDRYGHVRADPGWDPQQQAARVHSHRADRSKLVSMRLTLAKVTDEDDPADQQLLDRVHAFAEAAAIDVFGEPTSRNPWEGSRIRWRTAASTLQLTNALSAVHLGWTTNAQSDWLDEIRASARSASEDRPDQQVWWTSSRHSWKLLERDLAGRLRHLRHDDMTHLTQGDVFVQFLRDSDLLALEVVSNHYLPQEARQSPEQEDRLRTMGWRDPDSTGFVNWRIEEPCPVSGEKAAHLAALLVAALRDVHGVHSPEQLEERSFKAP